MLTKRLSSLVLTCGLLFLLAAWGSAAAQTTSITFVDTAGGANFQKWFHEIIPSAEKDLGLQINYVVGSAPEIQQRLKAAGKTGGDIDILLLKPDGLTNMLQAGLSFVDLTKHTDTIPNLKLVTPSELQEALGTPTHGQAVPFWHDQFGILYNSAKIKNPPTSWQDFYNERKELSGHIGMIRPDSKSGGGRIMMRDLLLGFGADFKLPFDKLQQTTAWKAALAKFEDFSKYMYKPLASTSTVLFQQFASGQVWITEYAIDFTLWSRDQGLLPPTVKAAFFPSGLYGGAAYLAIPANLSSADTEAAMKFANWLLSENTQVKMITEMWEYMGINAYDKVPQSVWNTIPRWSEIKNSRIPLENAAAYSWLTQHGMDYVK